LHGTITRVPGQELFALAIEERVTVVTPGYYFGELAPMFGLRRSASARARGATVVTRYGLHDFRERVDLRAPNAPAD
jgi:CRP-like cAMP-binding protein